MESTLSLAERFNNWISESIMVKVVSIAFLILVLLIPSSWVGSLIRERSVRSEDVINEISSKWATSQTVTGPLLIIPFTKTELTKRWENGVQIQEQVETLNQAYFLPETLDFTGSIREQTLSRGIYDAAVYQSTLKGAAKFGDLSFEQWQVKDEQVHWKDAKLVIAISDIRGIAENPVVTSGTTTYKPQPSSNIPLHTYSGVIGSATDDVYRVKGIEVPLNWTSRADIKRDINVDLQLKGSDQLLFVPAGKTTTVTLDGKWKSPSFDGSILPESRTVSEAGFNASWKVLSFNRPFSEQWINNEESLGGSEFGVKLFIPADQYQKSERTAKYDILIILLAFIALFMVEITQKVRIHPFQYILVGVALTIYYTLLLSLSEHLGYNAAYAIASLATTTMLTLYSMTFLKRKALVLLFSGVTTLFYVFIFVIIQAEDFSLLIGSVGLFIIVATIMYFSRNVNWYKSGGTTPTLKETAG